MLLASGPIYADAVTISSLHRSLEEAPVDGANIRASIQAYPELYPEADDVVRHVVRQALPDSQVFAHLEADAYEIDGRSTQGLTELASLHYFEDLDQHASLVDGRWPAVSSDVEVALQAAAAENLELSVTDTVKVVNRRDPSQRVNLDIVGIYQIDDPADPYWLADPLSLNGETASPSFVDHGPFAVTKEALLAELTPLRANADWRILPRFERLGVPEVDSFRASVAGLTDQLDDELFARVDSSTRGAPSGFGVDTDLANLLTDVDRSLTVTRSSVLALLIQLAVLAGYALVLTAGLLVDTRRPETNLARARGTSPGQILGIASLEGLLLTAPAVLLGPYLAALLLRILNRAGPLAGVQLAIDPRPTAESYVVAGLAAGLAMTTLVWPAWRSAKRVGSDGSTHGRQNRQSGPQRLGVDLALLALTLIVFWQIQTLGPEVSARVRGQFGVDPLLVVAPALALLAGAILALRIVPLLARVAEWLASSRLAVAPALASWQVARRPLRYARSALLLMMAIAIGFFAASYSTTWITSQADQAAHATGADVSVIPDRATGSSIDDLHLPSLHRSIEGVDDSMPVARLTGQPVRGADLVDIVLLDAVRAQHIVNIRADLAPDFAGSMDLLAAGRPELAGVPLPGQPAALELEMEAVEEIPEDKDLEQCGPQPIGPETCFDARVRVVIQDGDGMLHRVEAGELVENEGPQALRIPLTLSGGESATPAYPVKLVSIEIQSQLAARASRTVMLSLTGISVVDSAGTPNRVRGAVERDAWELDVTTVVGTVARPDISHGPVVTNTITAVVETGFGFDVAPAYFTLRPSGTSLPGSFPAIVSEAFTESAFVSVGDQTRLPPLRIQRDRILVAGTIGPFPTVEHENRNTVIADLPTYQIMGYDPGRPLPKVDAYWLATDGSHDEGVVDSLRSFPFNSFEVESRQALVDALVSDPVALGTIGALTVGFVAAAIFAAVGFAVSATVSARERLIEFSLLRAVGLSPRQLQWWLILEQGMLVVVSLLLGTLIGMLLTAFILPVVTLTQNGMPAVPGAIVVYPWPAIVGLELAVLAVLGLIVIVIAFLLRRVGLGSLLRLGEE